MPIAGRPRVWARVSLLTALGVLLTRECSVHRAQVGAEGRGIATTVRRVGADVPRRFPSRRVPVQLRGGRYVDSEDENEAARAGGSGAADEDEDAEGESSDIELPDYWKDDGYQHGIIRLGEQAPDFSLLAGTPPGGNPVELLSMSEVINSASKAVVLVFVPLGFSGLEGTQSYTQLLLDLQRERSSFQALGAEIFVITREQPWACAALREKYKLNYTMLSDMSLAASHHYVGKISYSRYLAMLGHYQFRRIKGLRTSNLGVVVVDSLGRIIYKWVASMARPSTIALIPAGAPFPDLARTAVDLPEIKRVIHKVCIQGQDVFKANGYVPRPESLPVDAEDLEAQKKERVDMLQALPLEHPAMDAPDAQYRGYSYGKEDDPLDEYEEKPEKEVEEEYMDPKQKAPETIGLAGIARQYEEAMAKGEDRHGSDVENIGLGMPDAFVN